MSRYSVVGPIVFYSFGLTQVALFVDRRRQTALTRCLETGEHQTDEFPLQLSSNGETFFHHFLKPILVTVNYSRVDGATHSAGNQMPFTGHV